MNAVPTLIVMAKSPIAGRVKTRCCPPCSTIDAAALAEAALVDTLQEAGRVRCCKRVVALDGPVGDWLPAGWEVAVQQGDGLGERLDHAFASVAGPALLIGMDTPQVDHTVLQMAFAALDAGVPAVVGPANDGGFWAVGLRRAPRGLFASVPMSRADSGDALRRELTGHDLDRVDLPGMTDVDDFPTALAVAAAMPLGSRFRAVVGAIAADLERRSERVAAEMSEMTGVRS
jgi:glycosyltransferase A (GT-A) superfamily protein (DUF2064 family)